MTLNTRELICDVLVVGGGGAGLRAALAARQQDPGSAVLLATRGELGQSGVTALACSDRMAFHATLPHTGPGGEDAWIHHARDIYEIGGRVSDAHLAAILARNSREAYEYLAGLGVPFVTRDGRAHQFVTDGSEFARACYTGPYTAVHIEQYLVEEFKKSDIGLLEHCAVVELLTEDNSVKGALALQHNGKTEELLVIKAPAVIIATGGGGLIYADNVFPEGNSGSGYIMAYRAGAELVNMEFIQFGMASVKTKLNCSGSMMRAFPRLVNGDGREFLYDYLPPGAGPADAGSLVFRKGATWPVSYEHDTRIIDIAVYSERQKGQKVYLDYAGNPRGFDYESIDPVLKERYRTEIKKEMGAEGRARSPLNRLREINPDAVRWLEERGVGLSGGEPVEIAVCAQHFQGGIKINERAETAVEGLYAAGECAGGQHGANRPGGNALLDGQVFGKIAGTEAALKAKQAKGKGIAKDEVSGFMERLALLRQSKGIPAGEYLARLREIMSGCAAVVRTTGGLEEGLSRLEELKKMPPGMDSSGWEEALDAPAMATLAEAVLRAALLRDESRGPHLRFAAPGAGSPLPRRDPEWQRCIVISEKVGQMNLELREPVKSFLKTAE